MDIYDLADLYADQLIHSSDFMRLLELKELIKKELSNKIIAFKTAEAKYLEAKSYGNYHPDLKEYQRKFTVAKTNLYSEAYVKEYIQLERKIQSSSNADFNDLKKSISNKFKLNQF